jgi:hypothetical protein
MRMRRRASGFDAFPPLPGKVFVEEVRVSWFIKKKSWINKTAFPISICSGSRTLTFPRCKFATRYD